MQSIEYVLRAKSRTLSVDPDRLVGFDLTVERRGERLGGNNVQAVVGSPSEDRYGLDEDVALWLPSGWWVSLRNQFAEAPEVAGRILSSIVDELSTITMRAGQVRDAEADALTEELFATSFRATGPNHWR